jgi:exosortase A
VSTTSDERGKQHAGLGGRLRPAQIVAIVAIAASLAVVYRQTLVILWRTWENNPNYSHGYLIPPVVAFLLWRERARFARAIGRGSAWGLVLILLGLVGHVASIRAGVFMVQGYSLVVVLFGLVLFFLGGRAARAIWFPLGYLVFMLPMPPLIANVLSFRLKAFAARAGSAIAFRAGIPLARTGMTIHLPAGSLRIADPCSGLRSLIALVALGALFAYLTQAPLWKRLVLFLAAIPLAVFANIVRIAVLCGVANVWGVDAALGFFHDFSGLLLFIIAFVGLVVVRRLLRCEPARKEAA